MSIDTRITAIISDYLQRVALPRHRRAEVAGAGAAAPSMQAAFSAVHSALAGHPVDQEAPAYGSLRARLDLVMPAVAREDPRIVMRDVQGHDRISTTPRLERVSMVPRAWPGGFLQRIAHPFQAGEGPFASKRAHERDGRLAGPRIREAWFHVANRRRLLMLGLALGQTWLATMMMSAVLPYHGQQPLELVILALFAVLFTWVSMGFWTAIAGFIVLAAGRDRYAISRSMGSDARIDPDARTAIIMPICNENVPRVFAGLRATYESLARTGNLEHFDFFVLSDSGDPDTRIAEVAAWNELCKAVSGYGRVFYRWRRHRIKRKSGNIADFCRRWGSRYRYMIVLDADSVMSGRCLTSLVRLAEANPTSGIIQTAPRATGRDTLYARMQQFATRLYGPLFTAGLHYWQLGESHYWGHNAIIRVAPFIRYCALGRLPGRGALAGEILSHDFVEAALMRRAGWAVWIAYDLPGSYEEMPPNLVDELKRDRRWCQGNLMNFRLFLLKGLHPAHRAVFMTGVMAYLSAPLWFLFLLLSTVQLAMHTLVDPEYFVEPYQLFPRWPEWRPEWAIGLVGATALLLFLPKLLSVLLVSEARVVQFGGSLKLVASVAGELLASALLAPIRMLFHTRFVVMALAGWSVSWKSPPREDAQTTWGEAIRRHGLHTTFGIAWAAFVYWLDPAFLYWLLPVVGALMLSIPISVYTSRASIGRRMREKGLFLIPEETYPPQEIRATARYLAEAPQPPDFVKAIVDPALNAIVSATATARANQPANLREQRLNLTELALSEGPDALTPAEKTRVLDDAIALSQLHFRVWTQPAAHPRWHAAKGASVSQTDLG